MRLRMSEIVKKNIGVENLVEEKRIIDKNDEKYRLLLKGYVETFNDYINQFERRAERISFPVVDLFAIKYDRADKRD